MDWVLVVLIGIAVFALGRIAFSLRRLRQSRHSEDWDTRILERLRAHGLDPFQPCEVEFFLALPSDAAGNEVMTRLEADGYAVHVKVVPESVDLPVTLRATRSMRVSLEEMKAMSARFAALAREQGGRCDGWKAGQARAGSA